MEILWEKGDLRIRRLEYGEADALLMHTWLSDPETLAYYEGRDRPLSMEDAREEYGRQPSTEDGELPCILEQDGLAVGYVQVYPLEGEELVEYWAQGDENPYALDWFLGEERHRGKGLGTRFLALILEMLTERFDADWVYLDPQTWNERGIACYRKCGFAPVRVLEHQEMHEGKLRHCLIMRVSRQGLRHGFGVDLRRYLHGLGADLVGFGDLTGLAELPYGISVGVGLPAEVLSRGSDLEYDRASGEINRVLDALVVAGADYLRARGYQARAMTRARVADLPGRRTALPHKTVATRAGLGWIGRSGLLVNPVYGAGLRISSLVTDAPLPAASPVGEARCGDCFRCVEACDAGAISGAVWAPGVDRDALLDVAACEEYAWEEAQGRRALRCARCLRECLYTEQHVARILEKNIPEDVGFSGIGY